MRLLRAYNWLMPLTVALGILAYAVAEENLAIFVIAAPIILAARILSPPLRPQRVFPQWLIYCAVVGATAWMFVSWSRAGVGDSVVVLARYLVALQLMKLFDNTQSRDHLQVIALSAMQVVGACLTSVNADLGAVLVLYVPVAIATAVTFQLYAARHPNDSPEPLPTPAVAPEAPAQLRRLIVLPMLAIAIVTGLVFVATPRLDVAIQFLPWAPKPRQASALNNQIRLGEQGVLSDSKQIVLTMRVESEQDQGASGRAWRLRSSVLDEYDFDLRMWRSSGRVRPKASGRDDYFSWAARPSVPEIPAHSTVYDMSITVQPGAMFRLYAPWRPISFEAVSDPPAKAFRFNRFSGAAEMSRLDYFFEPFTYIVRVTPSLLDETLEERVFDGERWDNESSTQPVWMGQGRPARIHPRSRLPEGVYLRLLPPRLPRPAGFQERRVAELAEFVLAQKNLDLHAEDPDAAEKAVSAFKKYLEDNFIYTNEMVASAPGQDPIDMFLFDPERGGRGHCEYFAAALAAMCQSVGIPARVILGYMAAEYDSLGRSYTVRESDAHAWVEAEVRPGLWREYDPSPSIAELRVTQSALPVVHYLRRAIDYLQFAWVRSIVAFDRDSQEVTLEQVGRGPLSLLRTANDWVSANLVDRPQEIAQRNPALAALRTFLWVIAVATGVGLTLMLLVGKGPRALRRLRDWLLGAPAPREAEAADPVVRDYAALYELLLKSAAALGYTRPRGATPLAVAFALRGRDRAMGERAESFADLYYRARFGADPEAGERLPEARRLVSEAVERAGELSRAR